ncbi:hypothetical protein [Lysobacter sp. Root690]|uniref:hypothetical protein n=1 Tax=Lysobacter sp. Root690 TaxID=1736588 RepID=UPI000A6D35A3|nr:hypothetical protein [Lysobacter sp. Root690]
MKQIATTQKAVSAAKPSAAKLQLTPAQFEKKAPQQGQYAPRSCSRFIYCV